MVEFLSKYLSQSVVAEAVDSGSLIMGCLIICSLHQSEVSIECHNNLSTNQKRVFRTDLLVKTLPSDRQRLGKVSIRVG